MNARDVQYVINSQLRQLQSASSDPLSDDFYFQHWIRRRQKMVAANLPQPDMPLPSWRSISNKNSATGEALAPTREERVWQARDKGTRTWESTNRVLGHTNKSHIARPRQLLAVPSVAKDDKASETRDRDEDYICSAEEAVVGGREPLQRLRRRVKGS